MVEKPDNSPGGVDLNWQVTPERLERIKKINEDFRTRVQAMRSARPLYEDENGKMMRGSFIEFVEGPDGARPVYQTPDGKKFFISPFYDPRSENEEPQNDGNP